IRQIRFCLRNRIPSSGEPEVEGGANLFVRRRDWSGGNFFEICLSISRNEPKVAFEGGQPSHERLWSN
ncbi:MAG: hypothetical protein NZ534_08185, partial [Bacteroidia bacterium]|nr:hypothetical protein [Bacteroidia bacterium]